MLKRSKLIVVCSVFLFVGSSLKAQLIEQMEQKKIYKTFLDTSSRNKRIITYALPYSGYDPETSLAFGFNVYSIFKIDTLESRNSSVYLNAGYSLKKQLSLLFSHTLLTKKEKWLLKGRVNYLDFPLTIYGIGNLTSNESSELIHSEGIHIYQKVLKKVLPGLFVGGQFRYYKLKNIHSVETDGWFNTEKPLGYKGFEICGLGANVRLDTRNNLQSPNKGIFLDVSYYNYSKKFKSQFEFSTLDIDLRIFTRPFKHKKTILAFWLYNSFSQGDVVWKELPQTGIYGTSRAYVKGRYRDDYFLDFEVEMRTPLWWRWWGVAFAGISTLAENTKLPEYWNPSVGCGLRFLLKSKEQLYTGFDFALGRDHNKGIYVRLGQAF